MGLGTPATTGKHQEQRRWLGQLQRFERQTRLQAGLTDEVFLRETIPSRLEEVAVLSNVQKPTQRTKKNEETRIYSKQRTR